MRRFSIPVVSLIAMLIGVAAAAQEADPPEEAAGPAGEVAETVAESGDQSADASEEASDAAEEFDEFDDADLDLQTYEQDDDDFVPTEEIPADEAIPFPSDI